MTSVLRTDRAVSLHHNFTLLYVIYPFERRCGRALILSISHESEGYDKGNIVIKDVVVTMGMLCAPRLSLKPLIHDYRSYVDFLLFYMRTPSCAVCLLCQLVGIQTRQHRTISFSVDMMLNRCQSYHFFDLAPSGLADGPS